MKLIKADMAGTLLEVKVSVGGTVSQGQEIAVIESMKMEVPVMSSESGVVGAIHKSAGDFVNAGELLIELK